MTRPRPLDFLFLILLGMIFGSSFVFIKVAVATIPPFMVVGLRVTFAAIFLNIVLRIVNKRLVNFTTKWKDYAIQGAVGYTIPFFLISYGAQKLDSSYVAIMMASLPIITLIIAHFFTDDEKMSLNKIIGVSVGFIGVMVLIFQDKVIFGDNSIISCLMVLSGCVFFAISTVTGRKFKDDSPLVTTTGALTCAAVYLFPISLLMYLFEEPVISLSSLSSVALLGFLCTGVAYYIFFRMLAKVGATWTSIHDYLVPIFGSIFGVFFFGEKISIVEITGVFIILCGMFVMYYGSKLKRRDIKKDLSEISIEPLAHYRKY